MFEDLAAAVDPLEIPVSGAALAELAALHHRLGVRLAQAAHRFAESRDWALDAAVSAKGWLTAHAAYSDAGASRLLATGRKLANLPITTDAALDGTLGSGQLEMILGAIRNSHVEKFAEYETTLIPQIAALSASDTAMVMRHWKNVITSEDEPPTEPPPSLHLNNLPDGRYALNGTLSEDAGNTVDAAIRLAVTDDVDGEPERTPAERRADALTEICQFYLDHHASTGLAINHPALIVKVDLEVLERRAPGIATRITGQPLTRAVLDRIACDADIHRYITDGAGVILDFSRRTREISDHLRAAITTRDGTCRFPECRRTINHCQVHHVIPWTEFGPTDPTNLAALCLRHHQILHTPGWAAKLLPDATLIVTTPTGRTLTSHLRPYARHSPTISP